MSRDPAHGLLFEYMDCSGCHTCEVACKQEHNLPAGKWGIKVCEIGPFPISDDKYELFYVPIPTDLCDLCKDRVRKGKLPSCVHHCQTACIKYGLLDELYHYMIKNPKTLIWYHQPSNFKDRMK